MKHFNFLLLTILVASFTACNNSKKNITESLPDGIYAYMETSKGNMTISLEFEKTPYTVANFITLAEGKNTFVSDKYKGLHYYDGLTFHRVIENFMAQGGDPEATGQGGPGYVIKDEFHASLKHDKIGVLSMANSGPNTNGSQFFITTSISQHLDNKHSVFGHVIEGIDVLETLAKGDIINTVTILRKGTKAKKFDAIKTFKNYYNNVAKIRDVLEEVKAKKTISFKDVIQTGTKTKSGLIYKITKPSKGKKPIQGQKIFVHYAGYFEDGTLFDTSIPAIAKEFGTYDKVRDQQQGYSPLPIKFGDKAAAIAGFVEGLEKLKFGEKAIIYLPSHLGYGEVSNEIIPANSKLIFEIELLEKPN